jgi:Cysteine-rich CWC
MTEANEKTCPRCQARFECFAPNRCWCHDLPALEDRAIAELAASGADGDCLCPKCLAALVDAQGKREQDAGGK